MSRQEAAALTRRSAIGLGAAVALGTVAASFATTLDEAEATEAAAAEGETRQVGFLVRTGNCVNCGRCVQACRVANQTPEGMAGRRKIVDYEGPDGLSRHVSLSCMHCKEPACAAVCPAQAITKGVDGIVSVDESRCIGCKYCYQACPFGVPHYGARGMDKCDCCLNCGIEPGSEPYCAQACMFDALSFGYLDELEASAHGMAQQVECPTGPAYLIANY